MHLFAEWTGLCIALLTFTLVVVGVEGISRIAIRFYLERSNQWDKEYQDKLKEGWSDIGWFIAITLFLVYGATVLTSVYGQASWQLTVVVGCLCLVALCALVLVVLDLYHHVVPQGVSTVDDDIY